MYFYIRSNYNMRIKDGFRQHSWEIWLDQPLRSKSEDGGKRYDKLEHATSNETIQTWPKKPVKGPSDSIYEGKECQIHLVKVLHLRGLNQLPPNSLNLFKINSKQDNWIWSVELQKWNFLPKDMCTIIKFICNLINYIEAPDEL